MNDASDATGRACVPSRQRGRDGSRNDGATTGSPNGRGCAARFVSAIVSAAPRRARCRLASFKAH
eukprot:202325-Pleurochrysis_carterae.AAC.7